MRTTLLGMAVACTSVHAWAERPLRRVLFDFEDGIEGWWGNVWGGTGTCEPTLTEDAKFGSGAIHCDVRGVERGSNTVSPWLPADADWRRYSWAAISFWVKGDGSREKARFVIETSLEGEQHQTYSYSIPLDQTQWRKVEARLGSFWNRYGVPMDVSRIGRIMFGCSGTHSFDIDHIVLQAPGHPVPLQPTQGPEGIDLHPSLLHFEDGRYVLSFDPSPVLPEPAVVEAVLAVAGDELTVKRQIPGGVARDDVVLEWPDPDTDAKALISLRVFRASGEVVSFAPYACRLFERKAPPDATPLGLIPAPKEVRLGEGAFRIEDDLMVRFRVPEGFDEAAQNLFFDQFARRFHASPPVYIPAEWDRRRVEIVLGARVPPLPKTLARRISTLPAEGYVLRATPQGVRIVARDSRGLVHGLCTLFQAIESHYAQTFELAAPTMDVVDWPSLPIRAVSISIPTGRWGYPNDAPVDPIFFRDFLFRTVVMQKMNMVVLIVEQAMQYESHPKVSGPAAWPKETIGLIFDNMRRYGVEPVPLCNSLGHANWCAIPYRRLAEDGDVHQFCTSNPETKRVLLDIYQEIVDLVEPKYFHIGMDEIRWKTHTLPKEERCRLCAGKDKRDIFAEWVEMLRDFFAKQGIEVMMWGDMVLPDHNGGAPYHLSDALVRVPRDIVICNWSTALAPTSSYWFKQRGFQVIKANSRGATRQEQDWIVGNMMGIWYKVPWLMEGTGPKLAAYTYPSILEAAEYSWNFWPDPFNPIVPLTNDFLRARPLAQWRIAAAPVPRAQPPEPVALPDAESIEGIPDGEVEFAGLRFVLRGSALAPKPGGEARVEINRPVAALYLLHAAELPDRQAMIEALKPSESWEGVHIGGYEIQYASGRTKSIPIRYPMEVRAPQPGWCRVPVAHRALGVYPDTCQAAGKHLYAVQWVNPRLDDEVKSVTLRVAEGPARPMLVGLAIQEPR